jgi:hypothetical protein
LLPPLVSTAGCLCLLAQRRQQRGRQHGLAMDHLRPGFDLCGVVQRQAGDGESQHGHQADAGTDPVPLVQVLEPEGPLLVRNGIDGMIEESFMEATTEMMQAANNNNSQL